MSNFNDWVSTNVNTINSYLDSVLPTQDKEPSRLFKAMRYAVFSGGKRIRPLLSFGVSEFLGIDASSILPYSAALELIHTYSLIHDDLPAMDNDDFRRGKPTVHKKFDEATAILVGDALLTHAFFVASDGLVKKFEAENILKAISFLSLAAGIEGMVSGQQIDVENEGKQLSPQEVENMAYLKTGRLIEAAIAGPAILIDKDVDKWQEIGRKIGILFQVVDDILDEVGDEKKVGKKLHKDKEEGKNTFVTILGLEKAISLKESLLSELLNDLPSGKNLTELVKFIGKRDY